MKRLMQLTSALLLVSSTARTQQVDVATDTELRVAYCLGFTEQFQASIPSTLEFFVDRLRVRLLGYLQARGLLDGVRSSQIRNDCRERSRLTAPTFMALTCRWRSRPQHQFRTSALTKRLSGA